MNMAGHSIEVDGIKVGTTSMMTVPKGTAITVGLRFRPYWPGLFHLMAVMADQKDDRRAEK